jgi:hypothetical protein
VGAEEAPAAVPGDYLFEGGRFIPAGVPEFGDDVPGSPFFRSQEVGDPCGLHYVLYEHKTAGEWIVRFCTSSFCTDILVKSWPDLIELLGKLSPIALAAILDEEQLMAIGDLLEPTIAVRRRRRQSR